MNRNLPPRMRARKQKSGRTWFYYDTGARPRREIPMGDNLTLAMQKWASLHMAVPPVQITVAWAIGKYLASPDFDALGAGTRADYRAALDKLLEAFGDAPMAEVRPSHVVCYIDLRRQQSEHRAQRERAILSMVFRWSMARDWVAANPVAPVRGKRLPGRHAVTISDAMLEAVYHSSPVDLREALDLAYYTGQRPGDLLDLAETDIRGDTLEFRQHKTGAAMRLPITGGLAALLERIAARKAGFPVRVLALLTDERGHKMTKAKLRARFEAARAAAGIKGEDFQFRDMRRKAGADLRDQAGRDAAQALLGHATGEMTEHYTGGRSLAVKTIPVRSAKPAPTPVSD